MGVEDIDWQARWTSAIQDVADLGGMSMDEAASLLWVLMDGPTHWVDVDTATDALLT